MTITIVLLERYDAVIARIRRAVERVFGSGADPSETDDAAEADSDRITGTGEPILDEVYGQPGSARELERIDERAREIADERGLDLDDDRR